MLFTTYSILVGTNASPGTDGHLKIIEEMERGDPDKAADAMLMHLAKTWGGILDQH